MSQKWINALLSKRSFWTNNLKILFLIGLSVPEELREMFYPKIAHTFWKEELRWEKKFVVSDVDKSLSAFNNLSST